MLLQGVRSVTLSLLLLGTAHAATQSSISPAAGARPGDPSEQLFNSLIPRLVILVEPDDMNSLRINPRTYVHATVMEGARSYTNVAVHVKGGRGSLRPVDAKPGLTVNFDHFQKGQLFHGLDKIHLNNGVQDSTFVNEMVGSALNLAAGVPTARATHARVTLNDRDLGMYVLLEGLNKRFLKRYFKNPDGNLYDSGLLHDITYPLEKDSGNGPDDRSDLTKLVNAANVWDPLRRLDALAQVLDLDRFITFAAMERLLGHWDGYTGNRNNYRLYNDPSVGRFVFIPHGMDQLLRDPYFPLMPGTSNSSLNGGPGQGRGGGRGGILSYNVFDTPAMEARYVQRVGDLLDEVFTPERINPIFARIEARIRSQLGTSEPALAATMVQRTAEVRDRLMARVQGAREEYHQLAQDLNLPPQTAAPHDTTTPSVSK